MTTSPLNATPDPVRPGVLVVHGSPAALTTVPLRLARAIGEPSDLFAVHALHPSEQDVPSHLAYQEERSELGTAPPPLGPTVEVVELARPYQQNVVWIDRFHLLVMGAQLDRMDRLLGLYVTSEGQIRIFCHHPSVAFPVHERLRMLLGELADRQPPDDLLAMTRFTVWYDPRARDVVRLWVPSMYAAAVGPALQSG